LPSEKNVFKIDFSEQIGSLIYRIIIQITWSFFLVETKYLQVKTEIQYKKTSTNH